MKKTNLTPKQLFLTDLIAVIEKHGMIIDIVGTHPLIHKKDCNDKTEREMYENLLHTLKCGL